jgi:signal transduction histidine kinase
MRVFRSIKAVISLLVLLLGLVLIMTDWIRTKELFVERALARMEREAQANGTRMAGLMQHCFRNEQPRVAELEMSYAALLPDLSLGVVLDERGVVRYSTRLRWRGTHVSETPLADLAGAEVLAKASGDGLVRRDEVSARVDVIYPFFTSYETRDLGYVILSFDAGRAMERSLDVALRESIVRACYLSAACLLLWFGLDLFVTRRVDGLLEFAREVQEGNHLPLPAEGNDELGLIANAFGGSVAKLRETEARLLEASEEERRRIGRDIHDDVCQRIAAAQLKCGVLSSILGREGLPHSDMAVEVAKELQEAVDVTRGFAHGLCPVRVGSEGLAVALRELAKSLHHSFGVRFDVETDEAVVRLSQGVQNHIFRILQELMTNAAKHAAPTKVSARVELKDRTLVLTVENDGKSFDPGVANAEGLGLRFVQQRLRVLGGRLRFEPRSGGKTGTIAICTSLLPEQHFDRSLPATP